LGPGFKYHLVTVSAIFFALTVGLVVGSLFASPGIVNQQRRAIDTVQKTLNQDNSTLRQRIQRWEEFGDRVAPLVLHGRLDGRSVTIIQTGDYADAAAAAREAMQLAGAQVVSTITVGRTFDRPDAVLQPALAQYRAADARVPADRATLVDTIATALAHGDTLAGTMAAIEQSGLIHSDAGSDYARAAQVAVIVAGSRTKDSMRTAWVDQPLVAALQAKGLTVAMCTPQEAVVSDVEEYRKLNIDVTTVDNIDNDIGRCDLVFALSGPR
jgi:hypothetical protein